MSWKTGLQVRDLDDDQQIEATCVRCGHMLYYTKAQLLKDEDAQYRYLDEMERLLTCRQRGCGGKVRIALGHEKKRTGFVGGMA